VDKLLLGPDAIYQQVDMKDARPGDVVVFLKNQTPVHALVLSTAEKRMYQGQVILDPLSKVKTKNGIMPFREPAGQATDPTLGSTTQIFM
jgi:hypothetical protein